MQNLLVRQVCHGTTPQWHVIHFHIPINGLDHVLVINILKERTDSQQEVLEEAARYLNQYRLKQHGCQIFAPEGKVRLNDMGDVEYGME